MGKSNKKDRYARAVATTKAKYGDDFYSKNGKQGAANGNNRPFRDPEVAKRANLKSQEARKAKKLVDN